MVDKSSFTHEELIVKITSEVDSELGDKILTLSDRIERRGLQKGIRQGRQEGRQEAERAIILKMTNKGTDEKTIADLMDQPLKYIRTLLRSAKTKQAVS